MVAQAIDIGSERLIKVSQPEIPGLDPKLWPSKQSLYRAIQAGKLAAVRLPGVGLCTSIEALAAYSQASLGGDSGGAPAVSRKSLKRRLRERDERTARILQEHGLPTDTGQQGPDA